MTKKILKYTIIALIWLLLWQIAAMAVSESLLLPSPVEVAKRLCALCLTKELYSALLSSFLRIFSGLLLGVILGIGGGILTARYKIARDFFSPALAVIKSTPIASFIILILLWLDRDTVPVIISLLVVLPIVWSNIETAIISTDKELLQMARAYKMSRGALISHIYLPTVAPYLAASLNSSLGLAWKAGVAAEALILPAVAIGTQIYVSKHNLETVDLFAWTVVVIILSVIIEKLAIALLGAATKRFNSVKGGAAK